VEYLNFTLSEEAYSAIDEALGDKAGHFLAGIHEYYGELQAEQQVKEALENKHADKDLETEIKEIKNKSQQLYLGLLDSDELTDLYIDAANELLQRKWNRLDLINTLREVIEDLSSTLESPPGKGGAPKVNQKRSMVSKMIAYWYRATGEIPGQTKNHKFHNLVKVLFADLGFKTCLNWTDLEKEIKKYKPKKTRLSD